MGYARALLAAAALTLLAGCASTGSRDNLLLVCDPDSDFMSFYADGQYWANNVTYTASKDGVATSGKQFWGQAVRGRDVLLAIDDRTVVFKGPRGHEGFTIAPMIVERSTIHDLRAKKIEVVWINGASVGVPAETDAPNLLTAGAHGVYFRGVNPHFLLHARALVTPRRAEIPLDRPGTYTVDRFAGAGNGDEWKLVEYSPVELDWRALTKQ